MTAEDLKTIYNGEPIDIVLDASTILDLNVPRSDGRTWNDLIELVSTLPNVRIIIPSVVADMELRGFIPHYVGKGKVKLNPEPFNPEIMHKSSGYFLNNASRVYTDNSDNILSEIPGENPNIIIWDSKQQHAFYTRARELKNSIFLANNPEKASSKPEKYRIRDENYKALHRYEEIRNAGDNAILDYCQSPYCKNPVIIVSNDFASDKSLMVRALEGDDKGHKPYTKAGHAIGFTKTVGFLHAVTRAFKSDLNDLLKERNTSVEHIVGIINRTSGTRDPGRFMGTSPHLTIFPGENEDGIKGVWLDTVLRVGREKQIEQEGGQGGSWVERTEGRGDIERS